MNDKKYVSLLLVLIFTWTAAAAREVRPFDLGWKFALGDLEEVQATGFDDSGWRDVDPSAGGGAVVAARHDRRQRGPPGPDVDTGWRHV